MSQHSGVVNYDDVKDIFSSNEIWHESYEEYWYRYAWSILKLQNYTVYNSEIERYRVLLYALTLVQIYKEFCEKAANEYSDEFYYTVCDYIPDAIIGRLSALYLNENQVYDEASDILEVILPDLKYTVFNALSKKINACDAYVWMLCTFRHQTKPIAYGNPMPEQLTLFSDNNAEEESEEYEDNDEEYIIDSYEDYVNMINEVYGFIVNNEFDEGFMYLSSWM